LTWFDFNPSGGHEGVRAFKAGFGAQLLSCPVVVRETAVSKTVRAVSRWSDAIRVAHQ
jgi:hypothetical protein